MLSLIRSRFKNGFWFKVKAVADIRPEEYGEYFEDLIFAPNAEIGPKGVLKTASNSDSSRNPDASTTHTRWFGSGGSRSPGTGVVRMRRRRHLQKNEFPHLPFGQ